MSFIECSREPSREATSNWNKKTPFLRLENACRRFQVASHAFTDTLSNHCLFRKGPHPTAAVRAGGSSIPARALQVDLLLYVERIIYGSDANIEEMRQRLHIHDHTHHPMTTS